MENNEMNNENVAVETPEAPKTPEQPKKNGGKIALIALAIAAVIFAVLCMTHVICLKHDPKPATCTEASVCTLCGRTLAPALGHTEVTDEAVAPTCTETGLTEGKHCSVCNEVFTAQETVEALGHTEVTDEAVAPTCTETGLTEGKHCSVCSEVLTAQEVIPAEGHDFADATYALPATCRKCGATEGEAFGNGIFKVMLAGEETAEEQPVKAAEEPEQVPEKFQVAFSAHADGKAVPEEVKAVVEAISLKYNYDLTDGGIRFEGIVGIPGLEQPMRILASIGEKAIEIAMPDVNEKVYALDYAFLEQQTGIPYTKLMEKALNAEAAGETEIALTEEQAAHIKQYTDICASLFHTGNVTDTEGEFRLKGLGETVNGHALVFAPTTEDWTRVIRSLCDALKQDESVLALAANGSEYVNVTLPEAASEDPEVRKAEFIKQVDQIAAAAEELAKLVEGWKLEMAYTGRSLARLAVTDGKNGLAVEISQKEGACHGVLMLCGKMDLAIADFNAEKNENGTNAVLSVPLIGANATFKSDDRNMDLNVSALGAELSVKAETKDNEGGDVFVKFNGFDVDAGLDICVTMEDIAVAMPEGERIPLDSEESMEAFANEINEYYTPVPEVAGEWTVAVDISEDIMQGMTAGTSAEPEKISPEDGTVQMQLTLAQDGTFAFTAEKGSYRALMEKVMPGMVRTLIPEQMAAQFGMTVEGMLEAMGAKDIDELLALAGIDVNEVVAASLTDEQLDAMIEASTVAGTWHAEKDRVVFEAAGMTDTELADFGEGIMIFNSCEGDSFLFNAGAYPVVLTKVA